MNAGREEFAFISALEALLRREGKKIEQGRLCSSKNDVRSDLIY